MTSPTKEGQTEVRRELLDMTKVRLIVAIGTEKISVELAKDAVSRITTLEYEVAALAADLDQARRKVEGLRSCVQDAVDILMVLNKQMHARNPGAVTAIDEWLALAQSGDKPSVVEKGI